MFTRSIMSRGRMSSAHRERNRPRYFLMSKPRRAKRLCRSCSTVCTSKTPPKRSWDANPKPRRAQLELATNRSLETRN